MSAEALPRAEFPAHVTLGGTDVTLLAAEDAVDAVLGGCRERTAPLAVVSANLDHVYHFGAGGRWERSLRMADGVEWLTLLDGAPLAVQAQRVTGRPWPRLAGSDLIGPILDRAEADGLSIGFLGGSPDAQVLLRGRLAERRPQLRVAGFWSPSRGELEDPAMSAVVAGSIAAASTDVLVVGLGKPRQELWIAEHGRRTGARVLLAFGAVVDFLAERIQRAPAWVSGHGLEWAWRLALEPARLSERYLVQGPEAYVRLRRYSASSSRGDVALSAAARAAAARASARMAHPAGRGLSPSAPRPDAAEGGFAESGEPVDVAVLVATYNSADAIGPLLASLREAARSVRLRVVVADNSPDRHTLDALAAYPDVVAFRTGGNLGYAGAINAATAAAGAAEAFLILNPDTQLLPGAVDAMLARLRASGAGAVVPLMLTDDGARFPSLRREPSAVRAWGDALFGAHLPRRPQWIAETDYDAESYAHAHTVDWATGAALMVSAEAARDAGPWDERFFMYSEETDYCRALRERGYDVWFEPAAKVMHSGAGSGSSHDLAALMAVNKIRYMRKHHPGAPAALASAAVVAREAIRVRDAEHRHALAVLMRPGRWDALPHASGHATHPADDDGGSPFGGSPFGASDGEAVPGALAKGATHPEGAMHPEGSIVIPAHNEADVIARTLEGLRPALESGRVEVIVACNACTDRTAEIAARFPGVRVLELPEPGKARALNAADAVATRWPRVYLDADIEIPPAAVAAILEELGRGRFLAGRPDFRYDTSGCDPLVAAYYRARVRIPSNRAALWGAGCYAMTEEGHRLLGVFPEDAADDFYVDTVFSPGHRILLGGEPVVVRPPRTASSLVHTLHRVYRAPASAGAAGSAVGAATSAVGSSPGAATSAVGSSPGAGAGAASRAALRGPAGPGTAPMRTLAGLAASVRGPLSALDAAVYASFALAGRRQPGRAHSAHGHLWERDESSRR
ncbi:WecB/TagA/CpsF family glycosyltransferase [Sinomonas sp. ASV322]|uniref:WecB/TagA/CpsF family glycosyltransferase n=1 Tax=Sinomonas sp. ASV322 TaxID=3041920 RepID=UPI0027DE34D1|nr:WecB/TagA/CpsF family glycosyltransferase [Sinomonas sp. ASV322]MDQ4504347.1 WecB/TagA/CpsF family glycosyltransferase [Sinomonas sp. ASV322]